MDNYKVYIHIFPNKKVYIGITKQKPENRWNNGRGYKSNDYLVNAILKYGWDNIEHKILYNNLSKEEAEQKEIELIKRYKSNIKKYGYNILDGGNVSDGITEEVRRKISETSKGRKAWNKGKKMSENYRKKLSEAHKGKTVTEKTKEKIKKNASRYWLGKTMSKEARQNMSLGSINKNGKRVKQYDKSNNFIAEYLSAAEAGKSLRTVPSHILECCNNKRKTAGGYIWKYV